MNFKIIFITYLFHLFFGYFVAEAVEFAPSRTMQPRLSREAQSGDFAQIGLTPISTVSKKWKGNKFKLVEIETCNPKGNINIKFYTNRYLKCEEFPALAHPNLVKFLDDHLHVCTRSALTAIGQTEKARSVKNIQIVSQGIFYQRGKSNHSTGSSIDINHLVIEFGNGQKETWPTSAIDFEGKEFPGFTKVKGGPWQREGNALFEPAFVKCMAERIENIKSNGENCNGGILDCDSNSDHHNHIHLTVPMCPRIKGSNKV